MTYNFIENFEDVMKSFIDFSGKDTKFIFKGSTIDSLVYFLRYILSRGSRSKNRNNEFLLTYNDVIKFIGKISKDEKSSFIKFLVEYRNIQSGMDIDILYNEESLISRLFLKQEEKIFSLKFVLYYSTNDKEITIFNCFFNFEKE